MDRPAGAGTALHWARTAWRYLRAVSGDDAYERYLAHHAAHHADEAALSRRDFFTERQRQKWAGVSRGC